jgi:DNA-binding LytR/AlgR family response regulator
MNILIIEDEPRAAERLHRLISHQYPNAKVLDKIKSVENSVNWLQHNLMPDLILMDIRLEDGGSFEIFEQVEITAPVIFCTAYDEYALTAFSVNSIDYLLKPIVETDLQRALNKFQQWQGYRVDKNSWDSLLSKQSTTYQQQFLMVSGNTFTPVKVDHLCFLQSYLKACKLIDKNGKEWLLDKPLQYVEERLDPQHFFRISRQTIINLNDVNHLHRTQKGYAVHTKQSSQSFRVSRARVTELKKRLNNQ